MKILMKYFPFLVCTFQSFLICFCSTIGNLYYLLKIPFIIPYVDLCRTSESNSDFYFVDNYFIIKIFRVTKLF